MNRRGFTLLEIVVAASLFSIVMLTATGLFVATTRTQKRVQSLTKVQGDARFIVESVAQSVRIDGIDYTTMTPPSTALVYGVKLITKNATGDRTFYRLYQNGTRPVIGACVRLATDVATKCTPTSNLDISGYTDITPASISVTTFNVTIAPDSDPFLASPTTAANCRVNPATVDAGFDPDLGACLCTGSNYATACFPGQTCSSSTATLGVCLNSNQQPRATIVVASTGGSNRAEENATVTFQTTVSSRLYKR
ncbi:MAG: prepilin-type N-terminal cleavage/methylation domain-containing protein [Candidatus Kerfeldbacteria bacterium]|nr:prepilin-type N-terminal cleavage/methylation domain-containing protein [Candidatus Kerfeldbacteria bacterium]